MMKKEMAKGPFIPILVSDEGGMAAARFIEYGIEEEGIPFHTILDEKSEMTGYLLAHQSALGVALTAFPHEIQIFSRLRKDESPFMVVPITEMEDLAQIGKKAGKNAARIVKGKPIMET